MDEKKHNILHIHWFRDMIFAGCVFCFCDFIFKRPLSLKSFLNGAEFIFILDCIINTIINGIFDIAKEDKNKNGGI